MSRVAQGLFFNKFALLISLGAVSILENCNEIVMHGTGIDIATPS